MTFTFYFSVGAAVYTETLFKSGGGKGETFLDQQFWLYLYGMAVATVVHIFTGANYGPASFFSDVSGMSSKVLTLLTLAIFVGSIGGLVVAAILKYLDNIVKEYSGSVANVLTAITCSYLFPDKFSFTIYVILSLCCLLCGIYLYETKKIKPAATSEQRVSSPIKEENENTEKA